MSVFRAVNGQIFWQSHQLDAADIEYLRSTYVLEVIAASAVDDTAEELNAQSLLNDITKAIKSQVEWWQMAGIRQ